MILLTKINKYDIINHIKRKRFTNNMIQKCPNCGNILNIGTSGSHRFVGGEIIEDLNDYLYCAYCHWVEGMDNNQYRDNDYED